MIPSDDWADKLRTRYPWFPTEVYCGEGWAQLFDDLCQQIQEFLDRHPDYRNEFFVTQCKQKYGHLMFYAFPEREEIEQMVSDAGDVAMSTCEVCGVPGTIGSDTIGGWLSVLCDTCRKAHG